VGDTALKSVAKALGCVRPSDFLCRYGGEEFAVILPMTEREGACILAERLRAAVAETNFPHRSVTVSIGASTTLPGETDPSRLIESADKALYAAKSAGRNRIVHSDTLEP
jgi:diguanylate cyclase (GGDEF)-like protein